MRLHISQPIIPDRRERPNREKLHLSACISTGIVCPHCQLTMGRRSAVVGEMALRERRHLLSVCRAVAIELRPEFLPMMIMTVTLSLRIARVPPAQRPVGDQQQRHDNATRRRSMIRAAATSSVQHEPAEAGSSERRFIRERRDGRTPLPTCQRTSRRCHHEMLGRLHTRLY